MRFVKASEPPPFKANQECLNIKYKGVPDTLVCLHNKWYWRSDSFVESLKYPVDNESWGAIEWLDESPPANAQDEAERLYPYTGSGSFGPIGVNVAIDMQRSAHITCARQYMGEIDRLKAALEEIQELKSIDYSCYQKSQNIIRNALNIKTT